MTSAPAEKEKSISAAAAIKDESKYDHLSAPASAMASGTATPAEKKDEKEDEKEEIAEAATDKTKYEHLSVPASALQSGTATPAEPTVAASEEKDQTHAGSDIKETPKDEVKEVGKASEIKEEPTKEETLKAFPSVDSIAESVQGMQVGDGKTVSEQEAKKPEDAVKSVED